MIFDRNGEPVSNCLIHRITVDFVTESLIRFRNRRTRKSNKRSVWKSLFQNFCIWFGNHSFHVFVGIFTELDFLCVFKLCSMRFVRETNNVCSVVDKPDFIVFTVAKLLYRADIETAAFTCAEFFTQRLTCRHNLHFAKI